MKEKVLVLGAGIQGICCALAMQANGYRVLLIDREAEPLSGTSSRGEAKIHLGYVYANDPSFRTASLLLESAMHFAPLLDTWTHHSIPWQRLRSTLFSYLIHRDSMVHPTALLHHYERIADTYNQYRREGLHYIGSPLKHLPIQQVKTTSLLNPLLVQSVVTTEEVALNTALLKPMLINALLHSGARLLMGRQIRSVQRTSAGFRVEGETFQGEPWHEDGGIVVNCLWDNRLQFDASMDIYPAKNWVYRLKHRLLGYLPERLANLPSYTIVLGPFGDLVTYPNGLTYLSWYPSCMRGWSSEVQPPAHWRQERDVDLSKASTSVWISESLQAFDDIIPGMNDFRVVEAGAGTIFSWGETDIDDPQSQLHHRYNIGVNAFDGYFSIDTGKFTSGPLFAQSLLSHLS